MVTTFFAVKTVAGTILWPLGQAMGAYEPLIVLSTNLLRLQIGIRDQALLGQTQ